MERVTMVTVHTEKSSLIVSAKAKIGLDRQKEDSIQIWSWLNQPFLSKGTKDNYLRIVRQFFNYHWNIGLKEITTPHVTVFLKSLEDKSSSTLNLARSSLSSLFDHLCRAGYVNVNPVLPIKSKKIYANIENKILPTESIKRMIAFASGPRNQLLLKILYFQALRESEVIQLKPSSFILGEQGRAKLTVMGKGKKPRTIHVTKKMWEEIQEFILQNDIKKDQFIFSSIDSGRLVALSRQQVFRIVKATARRAKIDPLPSPHWFRHSSSRHALDNGANLFEISKTLGHSSLATTQIYLGSTVSKSNGDYLDLE